MDEQPVVLGSTIRTFAIVQTVAILIPVALALAGVELPGSTNLVGSFLSAMIAAQGFVKTYGRAPTPEERRSLAWLSLTTGLAISCVFVGLMVMLTEPELGDMLKQLLQTLPFAILAFIVVVVCGLYLAAYYVAYGPLARKFAVKRS